MKKCKNCDIGFTNDKRPFQVYCSSKCKATYEGKKRSKKPKSKICKHCTDEFEPYTSLDKFCSPKCRIENSKKGRSFKWNEGSVKNRMGENNPAYVHGQACRGTKANGEGLRLFRKNRDEYKQEIVNKNGFLACEKCGHSGVKFDTHHIIFRSEKPGHKMLHEKCNMIIVCRPCHNWFHKKKGNRNDLVEQRGLEKVFGNDVLYK